MREKEFCLRHLLRALCSNLSSGMIINLHESRICGRAKTVTLIQVQIIPPALRPDLAIFAMHTAPTRHEALEGVLRTAIAAIQDLTERERHQMGLPPDDGTTVHVYQAFQRVLHAHGGAWEEERARGHATRHRRLMGLEVSVTALDNLAAQYQK